MPVDLYRLMLRDGDRASAWGRVVAVGDECWFEPPLPVLLPYFPPGHEPAPKPSGIGVRVEGVDLEKLEGRRHKEGATEGWTCLSGTWRNDRLIVQEQEDHHNATTSPSDLWQLPPCDPPDGGWPTIGTDEDLEFEETVDLQGPEVVAVTMFHPGSRHIVAVIASEDPELTRRRLAALPDSGLCVVRSNWTRAQVLDVRGHLDAHFDDWAMVECGETAGADGQLELSVRVVRVVSGLADFAAVVPDGLLAVDAWLVPEPDCPRDVE